MIEQTTDPMTGADTCDSIMTYIQKIGGGIFRFNSEEFDYDWSPKQTPVIDFLEHAHM